MKKQIFVLMALLGFSLSCEKEQEPAQNASTTDNNQKALCISSDGIAMPCSEIEEHERALANSSDREEDKKKKYDYKTYSCTTSNGYPGLYCEAYSNGDCTSAFSCTIQH